jgi:pyruvate dehydrogenase E2 component (dihydrolipoamide acetyltransferase)
LAKELGVDIGQIQGTGPDGTITSEDVQAAANGKGSAVPAAAAAATVAQEPLSQLARLMAERTTQSWTSVPHFFLVQSVDAGALIAAQKKLSQGSAAGTAPTITDLLIRLIARVLEKHPRMNSSWTGDGIRPNPDINISVAMAVKDGAVGAVIPNANKQPIAALSLLRRELTERARAGRLRPADITGGTFTLSNLGMYKVDAFTAIITPPQCAILAVGAIADAVVPVDGKPGIRPMMTLTLSSDHRVVDGARAAEFLGELAGAIREPEKWL